MNRLLFAFLVFFAVIGCAATGAHAQNATAVPATVTIKVRADRAAFEPQTINVAQGQRVRLVVTSVDVDHEFVLPDYGVDESIGAATSKTVEFTASRTGRFLFHCSIGSGDGQNEMTGTFFVNDAAAAENLPVQFDDKTPGVVIVESGGSRWRIDTATKTVTRVEETVAAAQTPPGTPPAGADTAKTPPKNDEVDYPYDYHLINLPTPKAVLKGSVNLFFTHRFSESVRPLRNSARDLLGLDSLSVSTLGLAYGITDRLYISAYRSPLCVKGLCRTIEIGLGYHLLDEKGHSPLTLSAYASIEGNDNFSEEYTYNLQAMLGRSVTKYVHLFFSPELSLNANGQHRFNPRPENFFPPAVVANSFHLPKNTASFGFGLNAAIRPTVSLLFEFTPRIGFKLGRVLPIISNTGAVTGFFNTSEPEIGFGIEKRIGRHSFALTFTNTQTTTTSRYNSSNLVLPDNKFVIGFNVYRRFLK